MPDQNDPIVPQPQGPSFFESVKKVWFTIHQNPVLVAFEGGVYGAVLTFIDEGLTAGHIDFSSAGLHKLVNAAIVGGFTAVRLLYRAAPGTNPKP